MKHLNLAALALVVGGLTLLNPMPAQAQIESEIEVYLSGDEKAVLLIGPIEAPELVPIFRDLPATVETLHIESPGGSLIIAFELAEMVRNRGYSTYVSGSCISACTVIYQSGTKRTAQAHAQFLYHRVVWYGPGSEQRPIWQKKLDERYLQYGMTPDFLNRELIYDKFYRADTLIHAGVVQEVQERLFGWGHTSKKIF